MSQRDTGDVSRLFREIGLDDDDPDSHMVRVARSWPYRCSSCLGGLYERPTKRDPETDIPLCDSCHRYRVQLILAKEERRENRRNTVAKERT